MLAQPFQNKQHWEILKYVKKQRWLNLSFWCFWRVRLLKNISVYILYSKYSNLLKRQGTGLRKKGKNYLIYTHSFFQFHRTFEKNLCLLISLTSHIHLIFLGLPIFVAVLFLNFQFTSLNSAFWRHIHYRGMAYSNSKSNGCWSAIFPAFTSHYETSTVNERNHTNGQNLFKNSKLIKLTIK